MYLQMDPLELRTRPIQTGREMSIEPYPNRQFRFIDNLDRQFGDGSVPTRTRTRSDGPYIYNDHAVLAPAYGCNIIVSLGVLYIYIYMKNDLTRHVTYREAVSGMVGCKSIEF